MKKIKRVLLLILAVAMVMTMPIGVFAKSKKKKVKIIQPKVVDMMYSREDGNGYKSKYLFGYIELENKNKFHLEDVVVEISVYNEEGKRVGVDSSTFDIIEKEKTAVMDIQVDAKDVEKPELKVKVKKVKKKNINKDKRLNYVMPTDFEVKKTDDLPDGVIYSLKNKTKYDDLEPKYIKMFRDKEGNVFYGTPDYLVQKIDAGEETEIEISKPKEEMEIIFKLIPKFYNFQ